jgi:hypothetical protein
MSASASKTNTPHPRGKKTRGILAALVTLAAWAVILLSICQLPPGFDRGPHRALGQVLGQEALKLQQPGGRVILITRETGTFKAPAFDAQAEGLRQTLKKARADISATRLVTVDPLRALGVPPGDFLELLRKGSDKDVIVSLLGPPVLDAGQLTKLDSNHPRVIAVCSGAMPRRIDLKRLFDEKLLHVAVISLDEPAGAASEFDRHFKLITAANLADLPPLLSDSR